VALEFKLVLLEPADVELLAGGAALELAGDVFLVVADDSVVGGGAGVSMVWYGMVWYGRGLDGWVEDMIRGGGV
jgi:hypothetical protein